MNRESDIADQLLQGAEQLGVKLSSGQQDLLIEYLQLLQKWNKAYNLTAVRDPLQMVSRHLLDSLAIVPFLPAAASAVPARWLDVGTGAGLPGLVLAIVFPAQQLTLLDSNGKKIRFLHQVVTELKLENVTVCQQRIEKLAMPEQFDAIFSRAFSALDEWIQGSLPWLHPQGLFYAMKGQYPEQELAALPAAVQLERVYHLNVPGLDAERHLLILGRKPAYTPATANSP